MASRSGVLVLDLGHFNPCGHHSFVSIDVSSYWISGTWDVLFTLCVTFHFNGLVPHVESIFNMEYFDFCFLNFGIRALRYISTWNTWAQHRP